MYVCKQLEPRRVEKELENPMYAYIKLAAVASLIDWGR